MFLFLFCCVISSQVCGSFSDVMTRCAQLLNETVDVDFVDINVGCPIDLVFQRVSTAYL